jgi:ribosomal protein L11 methyltransferase
LKQLRINATKKNAEKLCDILMSYGASSASIQDNDVNTPHEKPIYLEKDWTKNKLWNRCLVTALFPDDFDEKTFPEFMFEKLPEKDWVKESLKDFKPLKIGNKLVIIPSWLKMSEPGRINVIFDPGLAFGTGKHATTRLCLKWLEKNIRGGETILDYGCGSGILAISALKLGVKRAFGVDIDPQAILSSKNNAKNNRVRLNLYYPAELPKKKFDIIVANILANPLIRLASHFKILSHAKTRIVLSGILSEQVKEVMRHYEKWYIMQPPKLIENWALLAGIKK